MEASLSPACKLLGRPQWETEQPVLPNSALRAEQEGWVQLRIDVQNGTVVRTRIIASSPKGLFDAAVLDWVGKFKYPSTVSAEGCSIEWVFKLY